MTIETTSTVSVASLRASFNARTSSQLPMPISTTKDPQVQSSLMPKKNIKYACPLVKSVRAQAKERDPSPTLGALKLKDVRKPASGCHNTSSPEGERQSPSIGSYDSSHYQNIDSRMGAESSTSIVPTQLGENCQGHTETEFEPLPLSKSRPASPPVRSPSF